ERCMEFVRMVYSVGPASPTMAVDQLKVQESSTHSIYEHPGPPALCGTAHSDGPPISITNQENVPQVCTQAHLGPTGSLSNKLCDPLSNLAIPNKYFNVTVAACGQRKMGAAFQKTWKGSEVMSREQGLSWPCDAAISIVMNYSVNPAVLYQSWTQDSEQQPPKVCQSWKIPLKGSTLIFKYYL
ncbi:hypothetical protein STEG23_008468, partial [Scotinomys teguina]